MKTGLCLRLGTLLICVVPTAAAEREKATEPKQDSQMLVESSQLQKKLNDPNLRILDVRSAAEYRNGHIPGAVRVDVGDWKTLATSDGGLHAKRATLNRILNRLKRIMCISTSFTTTSCRSLSVIFTISQRLSLGDDKAIPVVGLLFVKP